MKKKLHIYIILLTIGFLLLPNLNYACGTKVEKKCCNKEISTKKIEKDCCKNSQSKNKKNSCGGKCGHSNCTSSTSSYSLVYLNEINFKNNNFDFSTKKQKFHHSETFISSDFSSIWQPPKIK